MNNTEKMQTISSNDIHPRKRVKLLDTEISYVDTGEGDPIVFLHGNPTSSYLWRNIIPYVARLGRCLAPDLVGMGKSGKSPANAYYFEDHSRYLNAWFEVLDLKKNITLVLHDWGSALGFNWAYKNQEKVKCIVYMEAIVRPRDWSDFPNGRDEIFRALRSEKGKELVIKENFFVEKVLPKSILRKLTDEEMNAYREPFKEPESRIPTLRFAQELPIAGTPEHMVKIVTDYGRWLSQSKIPKLLITAEPGALLTGRDLEFCRTWSNQKETTVKGIHYIQEDSPNEIGQYIKEFIEEVDKDTPKSLEQNI
ncbi:haloalkane dehalogenase [Stygiobacter electus]|uniref:Haloalkane dehalogenase n=1 Tax=Stygiobacter electus TaxID=3032292 RepID=A0AAE3P2X3_9BACT|nr:haloalkane dehalogenase [Stygiobacter electus]MDF1613280.1 haloalkane dehalogenase [Stygiobacter electus]